jgi:enoyl-CoA hydratase/carnithine racemase
MNDQNGTGAPVEVYRDGVVGHVVLNRPEKRNAMTLAMVSGVARGVRELAESGEVEVVVLSGRGEAFSSGGDLGEYQAVTLTHEDAWMTMQTGHDLTNNLERCPLLVIARVHGHVHAGGLLLSLCSDLTVAADTAVFRVPELLRARPDPFIPPRLIAKVGIERAADLMFTARPVSGVEAERIGLVARCAPEGRLDEEVADVIEAVLRTDKASRASWKGVLRRGVATVDPWTAIPDFRSDQTADRARPFVRRTP